MGSSMVCLGDIGRSLDQGMVMVMVFEMQREEMDMDNSPSVTEEDDLLPLL